jgi:hypothetical protein
VFLQAVLAGQFLFEPDPDLTNAHEILANVLFMVVALQLLLAVLLIRAGGVKTVVWNAALLVLVISQIGLGYSGRDDLDARSIHVPMGVLTFGLSVLIAGMAFSQRWEREPVQPGS